VLYPYFFSHDFVDGLADVKIFPGVTPVQVLMSQSRVHTLIHELLHAEHVKDGKSEISDSKLMTR